MLISHQLSPNLNGQFNVPNPAIAINNGHFDPGDLFDPGMSGNINAHMFPYICSRRAQAHNDLKSE